MGKKKENVLLKKWIIEGEDFTEEEEIERLLCTFSEFITSVNPDYKYNKTYLNSYAKKFIQYGSKLKEKNRFLQEIIKGLETMQIDPEKDDNIQITIDQVVCLKDKKIQIPESFSWWDVMRKSYQYNIEYKGNVPFTMANEYKLDKEDADETLHKDLQLFAIQYKKIKEQEKKDEE